MRVLVSGYFGFGNIGDELILNKIIRLFSNTDHQITILNRVEEVQTTEFNIHHVPRWDLRTIYQEVKKCHVLISGGGGLLQDLSGPVSPLYYLGILALAQKLGKRTMLLGQGFGPLNHFWNKRIAKQVLTRADIIVPRDQSGMTWCQTLGVDRKTLIAGADLVWLMPRLEKSQPKHWVVCLRADWLHHQIPNWLIQLKQAADKKGKGLHFVAVGNRGDGALLDRIRQHSLFWNCTFAKMKGPFQSELEAVRYFKDAQLVLSMRYHGMILGALAGAVVVGFGRDRKLANLMLDLEQPILDETAIDLNTLLTQLPGLARTMTQRVEALRQRARESVKVAFEKCGL